MKKLLVLFVCITLFGIEINAQRYSRNNSRSEDCRRCCSEGRFVDQECQRNCNCHPYNDEAKSTQKDYPQQNG